MRGRSTPADSQGTWGRCKKAQREVWGEGQRRRCSEHKLVACQLVQRSVVRFPTTTLPDPTIFPTTALPEPTVFLTAALPELTAAPPELTAAPPEPTIFPTAALFEPTASPSAAPPEPTAPPPEPTASRQGHLLWRKQSRSD